MSDITLKNDKYRKARGGKAFLIQISCNCKESLLIYQKDGDGKLKRCYFNRIVSPEKLSAFQHTYSSKDLNTIPKLLCEKCKVVIGSPIIHFDGRLAFRLRQGFFSKKRISD